MSLVSLPPSLFISIVTHVTEAADIIPRTTNESNPLTQSLPFSLNSKMK